MCLAPQFPNTAYTAPPPLNYRSSSGMWLQPGEKHQNENVRRTPRRGQDKTYGSAAQTKKKGSGMWTAMPLGICGRGKVAFEDKKAESSV